jgi:cytochrome c-type biogenesis protein CcmH
MNIAIFCLFGVTLSAGLLFSLLRVLRPSRQFPGQTDEQALISIYENRRQLARQQFDNGELDGPGYELAQQELSTALAYELQNRAQTAVQPEKAGKSIAWVLSLALPLLAATLYLLLGRPTALDPGAATAQLSIPEMVARLERRLQKNPEDVQGWRMLGRSYTVLENFAGARDAYGEAYKREPGDTAVTLDYAEAAARANSNSLLGRPLDLIEQVLQHDASNLRAMILQGVALFQQDDAAGAARVWQSVLTQPHADAQTRDVVQTLLEQSRTLNSATPAQTPTQAPVQQATTAAVTVELSLSPQFAAGVAPDDTVFIFAQAATGPKMPLAVARRRAAELPLRIVLDDSSAMTQGMNLSSFNQVVVSARVSRSGNASAASGDLQGKSAIIDPAGKPSIKLVIDTKLP